jgi:hypothetical protein
VGIMPETKVREYNEKMPVKIYLNKNKRPVIVAYNECGYNRTQVDLIDVIEWVKENYPELLK